MPSTSKKWTSDLDLKNPHQDLQKALVAKSKNPHFYSQHPAIYFTDQRFDFFSLFKNPSK